MKLQVYQIDAWADEGGGWRYNNSIPLCKVEVRGEPTTRKILKVLRDKNLLGPDSIYRVDDYFTYEGVWCVQLRNAMPLFDLVEEK